MSVIIGSSATNAARHFPFPARAAYVISVISPRPRDSDSHQPYQTSLLTSPPHPCPASDISVHWPRRHCKWRHWAYNNSSIIPEYWAPKQVRPTSWLALAEFVNSGLEQVSEHEARPTRNRLTVVLPYTRYSSRNKKNRETIMIKRPRAFHIKRFVP